MKLKLEEIQKINLYSLKEISQTCKKHDINYYLRAGSLLGAVRHEGPIPWDHDIDIEVPYSQYEQLYKALKKELPSYLKVFWLGDKNYGRLFMRVGLEGMDDRVIHVDVFPKLEVSSSKGSNKLLIIRLTLLVWSYKIKNFSIREIYEKKRIYFIPILIVKFILIFIPNKFIENRFFKLMETYSVESNGKYFNPFSKYKLNSVFDKEHYRETLWVPFGNIVAPIPSGYDKILKQLYGDYVQLPSLSEREKLGMISVPIDQELYNNLKKKSVI